MDLGVIMLDIEQVKFLGASVAAYNSSVGWGNQESKLDVTLVEDTVNGDSFEVPIVGTPKTFVYGGFSFGGLVQSVSKNDNSGGSPIYNLTMVDPRSLLSGVRVILGDYNGPTHGVPNVLNVFGYYEHIGFGFSGSNGSGLSWNKIRGALADLVSAGTSDYGGQITYRGFSYEIDIGNMPTLPSYFKIGGDLSLIDIIQQVCDAGGCDFFVTLVGERIITIKTISRISIPDTGVITRFIQQTEGAVAKSIGYDMVNEVCGKFLIGGKRKEMFFEFYEDYNPLTRRAVFGGADGKEETGFDNQIWWCWGFHANGDVIIGDGLGDEHTFTIDSRNVQVPDVQDTYPTSLGEIVAALSNESDWETFLTQNNYNRYVTNPNGSSSATYVNAPTGPRYRHNDVLNPHFGKAAVLGLFSGSGRNMQNILQEKKFVNTFDQDEYELPHFRFIELIPGKRENPTTKLYSLIKAYADEFYGKKILVMIPNVNVAYDTEAQKRIYSAYPTTGGYLDESMLEGAVAQRYVPLDINAVSNAEDNTLKCYVRFDKIRTLDFSDIPESAISFSADGNSIFIAANVESDIYFRDSATLQGPRVIVTLPGRVKFSNFEKSKMSMLQKTIQQAGLSDDVNLQKILSSMKHSAIGRTANFETAVLPAMVAIPFESQVSRYGPWYARGAIGAMEYETDDSLTPWNYGTYANMNFAAEAKVTTNIANLQLVESGSIEFPGVPDLSLGDQLLSTGPYVSNIQITIGSQGVTTSYRMETWKPRFGMLNKTIADGLAKTGKIINQNRRNSQESLKRRK